MARWFVDRQPQRGIPSVSLRRLLPEARFVGCPDWEVSGCTDDHRRLDPGQVFVAIRDARYDGQAFVGEALDRGAAGVVVESHCPEAGRLQVIVDDARTAHARICQALAGDPSRQMATIGVTGTFGKTIAGLFARSILEAAGRRCGLIGALEWSDGLASRPLGAGFGQPGLVGPDMASAGRGGTAARLKTPGKGPWPGGAAGLAAILSYMVDQGCAAGIVEASAGALEARCFEGVEFQAAIATDVGLPRGMPEEVALRNRRAKARLFRQVAPGGLAVVNADDPHAEILGGVNLDARRVSYGMGQPTAADVWGRIDRMDASGTRFLLHGFSRPVPVELRLIGPRHVGHALAAAALALAMDIDRDAVVAGLEAVANVAGHLESIDEGQDFEVRVDAASAATPLAHALAALRAVSAGQTHLVLSGEGHQAPHDRRALAEAAERGADRVLLTLGNPRTEAPQEILDDMLGGFRRPGKVRVLPDRRAAIEAALADARPGDAVLISGKGRNAYQILADRVVPFDDFAIARAWLRARRAVCPTGVRRPA
ncbi:MurE-like ligase [Aquisphaera giovannonii]|uniref:MurE-like ligase n=1 Tax=Aquisphaera giovannonii TaxID=406548 RepID=A0A5B9W6R5_9BACT|nr:Mur ligase family protein [Aquisphaera giovannonii]QEH35670.1 MurE-like ligase [Aquisphaera giovannonii]